VRTTDSITSINIRSVDNSIFSAGVNFADQSVSSPADFAAVATINKFKSSTFNNSAVIADVMGNLSLGTSNDAAPTRPFFGVAADRIAALKVKVNGANHNLKQLDDPAVVPGLIAAQGVTLNNLQIRVV
jgi:hypothetical protein